MQYMQDNRICQMVTSGFEQFMVRTVKGREAISELFHFELELMGVEALPDANGLVGQQVTFLMMINETAERHVDGIVSRVELVTADLTGYVYRLHLVPWLWLLGHRRNCRIFQEKTVPDIVTEVLDDYQFAEIDMANLTAEYQTRLHCTQYRESDLAFVTRLLEEEGIAYHFVHELGAHAMILCDTMDERLPCPGQEEVLYRTEADHDGLDDDLAKSVVTAFSMDRTLRSGTHLLGEFNYHDPITALCEPGTSLYSDAINEPLERYDYPGEYVKLGAEDDAKKELGEARALLAAEAMDVEVERARGESNCRAFTAGFVFDLLNHDVATDRWLILAVEHDLDQTAALSTAAAGEPKYANRIECLKAEVPFRPRRTVPRPLVRGPQTAMVTGPDGEEIHTDILGRIKVAFHWDRYAPRDGTDSCWVRVAQSWAGANWGCQFVPRIGQEVVVSFLEGDPDRPLVTGSVYNGVKEIPFESATQSGIRTHTTPGGSTSDCNEIRFDDEADAEELFVQAQKDLVLNIKHDTTGSVGNNAGMSVTGDNSLSVTGDDSTTVKGDQTFTVTGDQTTTVTGDRAVTGSADQSHNITGDDAHTVGGDNSFTITGDCTISATNITLTGSTKVRLEVGGSFVEVTSSGVTVHGATAAIEGSTEATIDAPSTTMTATGAAEVAGATVAINGSGSVDIAGGTINHN